MKKQKIKLGGIEELYTKSLEEHGAEPKGIGWKEDGDHKLRFDKLTSVITKNNELTINDLGCGYGSLYKYLLSEKYDVKKYIGLDISPAMIEEAKKRISEDNAEFNLDSKLSIVSDYTIASGIFNVRQEYSTKDWSEYILEVIDDMRKHSSKGFSFNMLTSYVDWKEDHLYYGDPNFFFDYCMRNISKSVTLYHDYPLWEWTITVRK